MSKTLKKTRLPDNIAALLQDVKPTHSYLDDLKDTANALEKDPKFIADCVKSQFVEDVYRALSLETLNKSKLATLMCKSRQYLSKILNEDRKANFTIESLAEISAALNWKLILRMLPPGETMRIHKVIEQVALPLDFNTVPLSQTQERPEESDLNFVEEGKYSDGAPKNGQRKTLIAA